MTGRKRGLLAYQAALAEWDRDREGDRAMSEAVAKRAEVLTLQEVPQAALLPAAAAPLTPMDMLAMAVKSGAGVEVLERLSTLHERWQAGQARRAFDAAIAAAKAEIKPVRKNRKVGYDAKGENGGRVDYAHEDMAEIARSVDPILGKYGLSYRFRTAQGNGTISVTTIVTHRDGHAEETTLSAAPDNSGKKNSIQAIGSAITYLQRYGIKAALGLAASADDDGQAAQAPATITDAQIDELIALADEVGADKGRFCRFYKIKSFADIPAGNFEGARKALAAKGKQSTAGASNAAH